MNLYSPFPPETYSRPDGKSRAGVGYMLRGPVNRALWNLFWLSEPRVDELLSGGPHALLDLDMLKACDESLEQTLGGEFVRDYMLNQPAQVFGNALRNHPHTHLAPYQLRRYQWVHTVAKRALGRRGAIADVGNVTFAEFGGLVTTFEGSAKIMPLALRKS